jgi:hypothetical protein
MVAISFLFVGKSRFANGPESAHHANMSMVAAPPGRSR